MIILCWSEKITNTPHQKLFHLFLFLKLLGIGEVKLKLIHQVAWSGLKEEFIALKLCYTLEL